MESVYGVAWLATVPLDAARVGITSAHFIVEAGGVYQSALSQASCQLGTHYYYRCGLFGLWL